VSIAYYITSHGFGHFVRSAAVIKALPAEVPLIVRTDIPQWFLEQELEGRDYSLEHADFDCGTLGKDSTSVDTQLTFERAIEQQTTNDQRLEEEVRFLKEKHVRLVVADMPSLPLRAAKIAGVPSVCETNFTWVEIYNHLAARAREAGQTALAKRGEELVQKLREQYAMGELLLIPGMALPMGACKRQAQIPIIARTGRRRRKLLCEKLGLDPKKPLILIYLGREGYEGLEWERIREIPDAQFFTFNALGGVDSGVHVLPADLIDHSDATATADAVVGKLGYSLCAECAASLRPLIFPPRPDFIQAEALGNSMIEFGLGIPITAEDFRRVKWGSSIAEAKGRSRAAKPIDCSGAQICAEILYLGWREGTLEGLDGQRVQA